MQARLLAIFLELGTAWVLYLLAALSVLSMAVALERGAYFWRRRGSLGELSRRLGELLRAGDSGGAEQLLRGSRRDAAGIALACLAAGADQPEAAEEEVGHATGLARLRMEQGLAFLGTLGNNAPFVGLFGTVLGIIRAFADLSRGPGQGGAAQAVIAGVAEALVATAVGLLVALPAVAVFNLLQRRIRVELVAAQTLVHVVMAEARRRRQAAG